jgi:dGTPase
MYQHHKVVRMQTKAERFVADLFQAYTQTPEILPRDVQQRAQEGNFYRTICDYIAGMTDRFALQEHSMLFDPEADPSRG